MRCDAQVTGGLQAEQVSVAIVGRAVMYDFIVRVCAENKVDDSTRRLTSLRSRADGDDEQDGKAGKKEHTTTTTT